MVSEHSSVGVISARAAVIASALALALVVVIAPAAPATTATAHQRERTGVSLVSQTRWVTGSRMSLDVAIHSPVPRADLGLKLTVYSRLTSLYAFDLSESGQLAPTELVLGSTPIIPLHVLHVTGTGVLGVAMHVRLANSAAAKPGALGSPGLALDCAPLSCDGVYPLDVAVVDTARGTRLASFTTYLVYVAGEPGSIPLRVALVLPFGSTPALVASGAPKLTSSEIASLAATLATIRHDPGTRVTLAMYPQLLVALAESPSRKAAVVLGELRALAEQKSGAPSLEFLEAPFTPVNLDELTAAGLGREFRRQLDRAAQVFRALLGATPPQGVYLSTTPLDDASLTALARNRIERVVIPATGLPTNKSMSPTAPLRMLLSGPRPRAGALSLSAVVAERPTRAGRPPIPRRDRARLLRAALRPAGTWRGRRAGDDAQIAGVPVGPARGSRIESDRRAVNRGFLVLGRPGRGGRRGFPYHRCARPRGVVVRLRLFHRERPLDGQRTRLDRPG